MRRFAFEAEIYETLSCIPMAVRAKLDRAAVKIALEQWLALGMAERRWLCEHPTATAQEVESFAESVCRLVAQHSGAAPPRLSSEQQQSAFANAQLQERVAANARLCGFELDAAAWARLDDDERYALAKLGGGQRVRRNFAAALKEFLGADAERREDQPQDQHSDQG